MKQYLVKIVNNNNLSEEDIAREVILMEMQGNSTSQVRFHISEISPSSIEMVEKFHKIFRHSIGLVPQLPAHEEHKFREAFILEELAELSSAYYDKDLVKVADALGDLQYVLDGWFLNAGLQDKKQAIMEEIQRSNMTKACKTEEEADLTLQRLRQLNVIEQYHKEPVEDYIIVYRTRDRKVMKSINYQSPNLKEIIYATH